LKDLGGTKLRGMINGDQKDHCKHMGIRRVIVKL
jgi:hypothetical protein